MTFYIYTFGCKVNIFESEAMAEILEKNGENTRLSDNERNLAEFTVINSCMVTGESEKKIGKLSRRIKRENPNTILMICGCMSQISPAEAEGMGADIIAGNNDRSRISEYLSLYLKNNDKKPMIFVKKHEKNELIEELKPGGYQNLTRANLKIEDGCDCYCSYCIIPYARGHIRSMLPEKVFEIAKGMVALGHREIVLTGINLGMYGKNEGFDLCDAVYACVKAGAERVRLGSLEIDLLTEELIKKLSEIKELCPHFHTSLQSGSDAVLKRMNRKYNSERYFEIVTLLKKYFNNPAITTDVIVGFPGETEEEFSESVKFCEKVEFSKIHVFPYSRRPGTAADKMPNQVLDAVKKERAARLGEIGEKLLKNFGLSQIGCEKTVLFETCDNGIWQGHTEDYILVKAKSDLDLKNQFVKTVIIESSDDFCLGKII